MTALLQIQDARVSFGGVKAVDGISLEVAGGGVYGIVGPNGSGKTTLINAISGVQSLTSGRIRFAGHDITEDPAHRVARSGVARTFQAIKLLSTLTVLENVLLGAEWHPGVSGQDAGERALRRLGLWELRGQLPDSLPYGTRRRVELARALVSDPKLILLDEPVAGMSRSERDEIAAIMRQLGDEGVTQIVIEHDLRTLLSICDHLFVMNFGRLIAEGSPHKTAMRPEVQEAYLGVGHVAA